jgi:hypothetical protein
VVVACGAIAVVLQVTPLQTVAVAGQVIRWARPRGEPVRAGRDRPVGQSLPTNIQFRPGAARCSSQISINNELTTFVEGTKR